MKWHEEQRKKQLLNDGHAKQGIKIKSNKTKFEWIQDGTELGLKKAIDFLNQIGYKSCNDKKSEGYYRFLLQKLSEKTKLLDQKRGQIVQKNQTMYIEKN